jgi:nucleotide-binding universal stress UspA family protein
MSYKMFIPVDGSDCSLHAVRHAVSLAGKIADCSIHIAHAHEQPMIYGEIAVYVPREKIERMASPRWADYSWARSQAR